MKNKTLLKLTLRDLCNEFLVSKRKTLGKKTANNNKNRLGPVLDFSERNESVKKWPLAMSIDVEFAENYREFLTNRPVTRNGSGGATPKLMSERQVQNCMETFRAVLNYGMRAELKLLPAEFVNPVTPDLIGTPQPKNPLRKPLIPIDRRIELANAMDHWQFLTLAILLALPLRHEDISGALIKDVNFNDQTLWLGTRFGGWDFNKGRVNVEMPLPDELMPILRECKGDRQAGPLFLSRKVRDGKCKPTIVVESFGELEQKVNETFLKCPKGEIQAPQDRKRMIRSLLVKLGGVSTSYVGKQVRKLIGPDPSAHAYDLRGSITQEMLQAGVRVLELRYLTEHTVNDIISEYSGIDPAREIKKYYESIQPLLKIIERRAAEFGVG